MSTPIQGLITPHQQLTALLAAAQRIAHEMAVAQIPVVEACPAPVSDKPACFSPIVESEPQKQLDPRETWEAFEVDLARVMPKIQKHAAAGDLCRFIASLERMREVMA